MKFSFFVYVSTQIVSKLTLAKAGPDVLVEGVEGEDSYMVPAPWGHGGRRNLQSMDLFISNDEATLANVSSFFLALTLKGMRNIRGYRFPGFCTRSERKSVEKILRAAITASNPGGNYVTGPNITSDMMSPSKEPWGGFFSSEWAESRLYFTNTANTVNMSVNHEDHLSVQVTGTWGTFMAAEIFEEYAASIQGVERELNEAGYRTRVGAKWSDSAIGRVLRCSSAKGVYCINTMRQTGNWKWEVKPESEWGSAECPAIVSAEMFDRVSAILEAQTKPARKLAQGTLLVKGYVLPRVECVVPPILWWSTGAFIEQGGKNEIAGIEGA